MSKLASWIVAVIVVAAAAQADTIGDRKGRADVEAAMAASLANIKDCGTHPAAVVDWKAYDALGWKTADKDKREYYGFAHSTVERMGEAINKLCSDVDYKSALRRIRTVVYRPTDDKSKRLEAHIDGTTLTFVDFIFGSTRGFDDYEQATTAALQNAPVDGPAPPRDAAPPPTTKPTTSAPLKPQPASNAWDGTYTMASAPTQSGVCARTDSLKTLVVAHGTFSLPWLIADTNVDPRDYVKVGRIDGVVHADGTVTATPSFGEAVLKSRQVHTVKVKRELDAITSVPFRFTRGIVMQRDSRTTKIATMNLAELGGDFSDCRTQWAVPLPALPKPAIPQHPRGSDNPYPEYGPEQTGDHYRSVDEYNSGTVYTRGTIVYTSWSTLPHIQYSRCTQEKCANSAPGDGWAPAGWE